MRIIYSIRKFGIAIFLFFVTINSFAQLSGAYTIGGINPNYPTIDSALYDLNANGVSGSVLFNIRPGTYPSFIVNSIPNLVYPDSIIFQSETHDSSDVIITAASGTIELNTTDAITLKWLTIVATGVTPSTAIFFYKSFHCNIENCLLLTPNSLGTHYYDHSAIDILHNWNIPQSSVSVNNCYFSGNGCGINMSGSTGITKLENNLVYISGQHSIYSSHLSNLTIKNNKLLGEIEVWNTTGTLFSNNTVNGKTDLSRFTLIENNIFSSQNQIIIYADVIKNNTFNYSVTIEAAGGITERNLFMDQVTISWSQAMRFFYNVSNQKVKFLYSDNVKIANNEFLGKLNMSFSDYAKIYSNLFYSNLEIAISNSNEIYYNNFSSGSYLSTPEDVDARYNNFSLTPVTSNNSTIENNNYFPCGSSTLDKHPTYYNPNYIAPSNIRAQNPLLIGKGILVPYITSDFDGMARDSFPTIGANEICISTLSMINNITLTCGDAIRLKLCSNNNLGNHYWSPSISLNDSTLESPTASPRVSTEYYLYDSLGLVIDSALIIVNGFSPLNIFDAFITCGQTIPIIGTYNPSAIYSWNPLLGLSDSTIYNPVASPQSTTTYILQTFIPSCGIFYDTILVLVDPLPTAYGSMFNINGLNGQTYNTSLCADSFLWNFGDGQISTAFQPIHQYQSNGHYFCYLVATNIFGRDTAFFSVDIDGAGLKNTNVSETHFNIYPNPATSEITLNYKLTNNCDLKISIYNSIGQEVKILVNNEFRQAGEYIVNADVSNLQQGIYFYLYQTSTGVNAVHPLVINK